MSRKASGVSSKTARGSDCGFPTLCSRSRAASPRPSSLGTHLSDRIASPSFWATPFFTGTHDSLLQASNVIQTIELRQGLKIACLEEIAFRQGHISAAQVRELAKPMAHNEYGRHLLRLVS